MRAVYGRRWGLSEALQGGGWGLFQPSGVGWGVGCGRREHSLVWNQETGGRGGPTGGVVARSPVQNPGFRIRPEPGAAAWWGEIFLPQFPGSLTIRVVHSLSGAWALGFQPWKGQHHEGEQLSSLNIHARDCEKKIPFFPNRLLSYSNHSFVSPCSNYIVSVKSLFLEQNLSSRYLKMTTQTLLRLLSINKRRKADVEILKMEKG